MVNTLKLLIQKSHMGPHKEMTLDEKISISSMWGLSDNHLSDLQSFSGQQQVT